MDSSRLPPLEAQLQLFLQAVGQIFGSHYAPLGEPGRSVGCPLCPPVVCGEWCGLVGQQAAWARLFTMQEECLSTFYAQNVANTAWAYARLGIKNEALMAALAGRTMRTECLSTPNAQNVANTAWAHATLQIKNKALMAALVGRTMHEECLSTFDAQTVANTAWAYARLG